MRALPKRHRYTLTEANALSGPDGEPDAVLHTDARGDVRAGGPADAAAYRAADATASAGPADLRPRPVLELRRLQPDG